jgi:hypothetical protein
MLSIFNRASARHAGTPALNLFIMVGGDSIADGTATTYRDGFIASLKKYDIHATIYDGSQGGLSLNDFWNVATNTKGAYYDARWSNQSDKANFTDIILCLGTNDIGGVAGESYTGAQMKVAYESLFNELFTDGNFPALKNIYVRPLGRHTTNSSVGYDDAMQSIRTAQYDAVNAMENVHMMPAYYDLELADNVHPNASSYQILNDREAARMAYINSKYTKISEGMEVVSAAVDYDGVTISLAHQNGTDITVPNSGGLDAYNIDGVTFDKIEKMSANSFRLYNGSPLSGTPTLNVIGGSMHGLGLNPAFVRDNSPLTLPPLFKTLPVQNTLPAMDVVMQMTDLAYYMRPTFGKNFTNSTQFDTIKSIDGGQFDTYNSTDFNYQNTAFNGVGGIQSLYDDGQLGGIGDRIDPTNGFMVGFVVEIDSTAAEKEIFAMGDSSFGPYNSAKLYTTANNRIHLFRADAPSTAPFVYSGVFGQRLAIVMNVKSANDADIYINNATAPALNFNPHVDLSLAKSMFLNGNGFGNASNIFGMAWAKSGAHDIVNDPSIAIIMAYMTAEYNI